VVGTFYHQRQPIWLVLWEESGEGAQQLGAGPQQPVAFLVEESVVEPQESVVGPQQPVVLVEESVEEPQE
jgi:hypothetical protein